MVKDIVNLRYDIFYLLESVGLSFEERRLAGYELHCGRDIHFYTVFGDPAKVLHIQAYPGLSTADEAYIAARLMDYERLTNLRRNSDVPLGNEHAAVTEVLRISEIPYDSRILEQLLGEHVPELR